MKMSTYIIDYDSTIICNDLYSIRRKNGHFHNERMMKVQSTFFATFILLTASNAIAFRCFFCFVFFLCWAYGASYLAYNPHQVSAIFLSIISFFLVTRKKSRKKLYQTTKSLQKNPSTTTNNNGEKKSTAFVREIERERNEMQTHLCTYKTQLDL